MFVVELVMQGVRGIRDLARLRFQSGFNFVAAGNEAGKTTAVDSLQRLLFPVGAAEATSSLVSRYVPDASRGALVVGADDGTYYRVIQDYSKQAVNLSQYNAATKEFKLLHKDWDSAARFMADMAAGVAEDDFSRVFLFRREQYADRHAPATSPSRESTRPAPDKTASASGGIGSAGQARLAELRDSLKKAEEAADADYRWQSAKLAVEELRKKIASHEENDLKKTELEGNLADLAGCETLPEDLPRLLEEHEQRESRQYADSEELSKEREGLQLQLDNIPTVNIITDKWFIAGAVLGIVSLLAGLFLVTDQYSQYFPVAIILSVILMAVSWYKSSRRSAQRRALQKDIAIVDGDIEELTRKFNQESAKIAAYMRAVNAGTSAELKEKAENYRYFLSLLKDHDEARQHAAGDHSQDALLQQLALQQEEVLVLEKEAHGLAPHAVDTYALRQEIERLEAEAVPAAGPSWNLIGMENDLPTDFSPPASVAGGRFAAELGAAGRIGSIEPETLVPAMEAAAQRNLAAISGGKYVRIEVGHEGDPVVHAKDDVRIDFCNLSHGTRELVYFCLRTGLIEALAGKRRLPFILDDALAGLDPARQQAACQVLRSLGTKTQVILFSSNPALKAANDSGAELK